MHYENRQPTEGINVTQESAVIRGLKLTVAAVVLILMLFTVFSVAGGWLARLVPFSVEQKVASFGFSGTPDVGAESTPVDVVEATAALNDLAQRVMVHMDIPEGMNITVHYIDDDVINAFATLGGHVFFYRGLIERLPHENALAMVMAHEIAHVVHRDPISGFGGTVSAQVLLSWITGGAIDEITRFSTQLGTASFTRGMETRADTTAIDAINRLYGHINGADELFRALERESAKDSSRESWADTFLSTHPMNDDRIAAIETLARENEWSRSGEVTPMPAALVVGASVVEPPTD